MSGPWDDYQDEDGPWAEYTDVAEPIAAPAPKTKAGAVADYIGKTIGNIPRSGANFAKDIYQTVRHPVNTVNALMDVGTGAVQNVLPEFLQAESAADERAKADAVGNFYKQRYGSLEDFKNALQSDPVGVMADATSVFTGGGAAVSRVPGLARAGRTLESVGKAADPVNMAVKGAGKIAGLGGNALANIVGGLGTHTGAESIKTAYQAGREGGAKADAFLDNMRGNVPIENVLTEARGALAQMRAERGAAYRQGMAGVSSDKTVLNFQPIINALDSQKQMGTYKGKVINPSTAETQQQIADLVNDWSKSDPAEFHTPEGLDALKKAVGDIRDSTEFGSPSRKVADSVYHSIKGEITKQAPTYAKVMKDYESASELVKEIEKALSLGNKASADTAIRKLQSVMRNNVNTNFGNRLELTKQLENAGAPNLRAALAGQALNSFTPRGLGNALTVPVTGGISFAAGGVPAMLPALAMQSPRLMGETSYYAGKLSNPLIRGAQAAAERTKLTNLLYQLQQPKEQWP